MKSIVRNFSLLSAVFFMAAALSACASTPVESFRWKDSEGTPLPFTQNGRFPKGAEGVFTAHYAKNTFRLSRACGISSRQSLALSVETLSDRLVVGLTLADGKGLTRPETLFELKKGRAILYLDSVVGSGVTSVAVALHPGQPKAQAPDDAKLQVLGISVVPYFKGFSVDADGLVNISDGIGSDTVDGNQVFTIAQPFGGAQRNEKMLTVAYKGHSASNILFEGGGKAVKARARNPLGEIAIPDTLFPAAADSLSIRFPKGVFARSMSVTIGTAGERPLDLGIILLAPAPPEGADYSVYRWDLIPSVYAFDFKNYATQDLYLKRIAFYAEKVGYRGKLATDAQIASLHGWNAHDYSAVTLASFFTAAQAANFPLNKEELKLKDFLASRGVIVASKQGYAAGSGAIISITRETEGYLRFLFLTHESTHAIFFTDEKYREFATSLWDSMPKEQRWFWFLYFGWMYYDISSQYLMANEMQAYLLQQPVSSATEYFTKTLPERLTEKHPELVKPISDYMAKYGDSFKSDAEKLSGWLESKYGFGAGMTFFVH